MNKQIFSILFILLFFSGMVVANDSAIPGDAFYPGWKKTEPVKVFEGSNLFAHINGGSELFHEFGFVKLSVQYYQKDSDEISLELYQMTQPEAALGIYLMKCGEETPLKEIKARNSSSAAQFTIKKGNYFIQVNNFAGSDSLLPAMTTLANLTLAGIAEGEPVTIFNSLPKKNLIPGTEKLIRGPFALQPVYTLGEGDILNLNGEVFGLLGEYADKDNSRYTRIIIPYPDTRQATEIYNNLILNLDPYLQLIDQGENRFTFIDYKKEYGMVILKDSRIEISIKRKIL